MQTWMTENLEAIRYNNGDSISFISDNATWSTLTTGAFCYYENSQENNVIYGIIYNWYAIADPRNLCPMGWHVPGEAEWKALGEFLGGTPVAGGKMKESGTVHWPGPNNEATNESGFTALPGGMRDNNGSFFDSPYLGRWWSIDDDNSTEAWSRFLSFSDNELNSGRPNKAAGYSVRCIKN